MQRYILDMCMQKKEVSITELKAVKKFKDFLVEEGKGIQVPLKTLDVLIGMYHQSFVADQLDLIWSFLDVGKIIGILGKRESLLAGLVDLSGKIRLLENVEHSSRILKPSRVQNDLEERKNFKKIVLTHNPFQLAVEILRKISELPKYSNHFENWFVEIENTIIGLIETEEMRDELYEVLFSVLLNHDQKATLDQSIFLEYMDEYAFPEIVKSFEVKPGMTIRFFLLYFKFSVLHKNRPLVEIDRQVLMDHILNGIDTLMSQAVACVDSSTLAVSIKTEQGMKTVNTIKQNLLIRYLDDVKDFITSVAIYVVLSDSKEVYDRLFHKDHHFGAYTFINLLGNSGVDQIFFRDDLGGLRLKIGLGDAIIKGSSLLTNEQAFDEYFFRLLNTKTVSTTLFKIVRAFVKGTDDKSVQDLLEQPGKLDGRLTTFLHSSRNRYEHKKASLPKSMSDRKYNLAGSDMVRYHFYKIIKRALHAVFLLDYKRKAFNKEIPPISYASRIEGLSEGNEMDRLHDVIFSLPSLALDSRVLNEPMMLREYSGLITFEAMEINHFNPGKQVEYILHYSRINSGIPLNSYNRKLLFSSIKKHLIFPFKKNGTVKVELQQKYLPYAFAMVHFDAFLGDYSDRVLKVLDKAYPGSFIINAEIANRSPNINNIQRALSCYRSKKDRSEVETILLDSFVKGAALIYKMRGDSDLEVEHLYAELKKMLTTLKKQNLKKQLEKQEQRLDKINSVLRSIRASIVSFIITINNSREAYANWLEKQRYTHEKLALLELLDLGNEWSKIHRLHRNLKFLSIDQSEELKELILKNAERLQRNAEELIDYDARYVFSKDQVTGFQRRIGITSLDELQETAVQIDDYAVQIKLFIKDIDDHIRRLHIEAAATTKNSGVNPRNCPAEKKETKVFTRYRTLREGAGTIINRLYKDLGRLQNLYRRSKNWPEEKGYSVIIEETSDLIVSKVIDRIDFIIDPKKKEVLTGFFMNGDVIDNDSVINNDGELVLSNGEAFDDEFKVGLNVLALRQLEKLFLKDKRDILFKDSRGKNTSMTMYSEETGKVLADLFYASKFFYSRYELIFEDFNDEVDAMRSALHDGGYFEILGHHDGKTQLRYLNENETKKRVNKANLLKFVYVANHVRVLDVGDTVTEAQVYKYIRKMYLGEDASEVDIKEWISMFLSSFEKEKKIDHLLKPDLSAECGVSFASSKVEMNRATINRAQLRLDVQGQFEKGNSVFDKNGDLLFYYNQDVADALKKYGFSEEELDILRNSESREKVKRANLGVAHFIKTLVRKKTKNEPEHEQSLVK